MNVLFIARRFPPSVGGMERFAFDLSKALGDKVHLKKITWGGSNKWLPLVLPMFTVRAMYRLLVDRSIDVIHIQDAVQAPIGWLLSRLFHKPYVVVAHGLDITYKSQIYQVLIPRFVRKADAVISISAATKAEVVKRGVDDDKSYVVTLGTHDDYGEVTPNRTELATQISRNLTDKIILLTTGRLVKRKGVAWFVINVLPVLVKQNDKILYLVVGDGAERESILHAINNAKMSKHVMLLGRVSDELRALLYQSSDVFVMPNIVVPGDMEGFGIVVHEAATAGLPVVASNLEGIADALKQNKNGILVEPGDVNTFVHEISNFITDSALRKSFGRKAREFTLREYSLSRIADQYSKIYEKVKEKSA